MDVLLTQTMLIVILTCTVSLLTFNRPRLIARLIFWPPAIKRWQFSRFVTHGLIHADFQHLLFNMVTLFFFGTATEQFFRYYLGYFGFLAFYVAAIVVAIFPTYLRHHNDINYRALGASGAVSAVLFSFVLLRPWATIYVFVIPLPAIVYAVLYTAYSVYAAAQRRDNTNHSAHLTGAIFGILMTVWASPQALTSFFTQLLHPSLGFGL